MAAYRVKVHDATGYSSNFLMFGRELRAPVDLVLRVPDDTRYANLDEFVEAVRLSQREAYALARDHLGMRAERNKHSYGMFRRSRPPNSSGRTASPPSGAHCCPTRIRPSGIDTDSGLGQSTV